VRACTGRSHAATSASLSQRAMRAMRHGIAGIHGNGRHCGICKLQNLKEVGEFESHSLRHQ
jgi:hypothetical protein